MLQHTQKTEGDGLPTPADIVEPSRALVISPSGRVYANDCVKWYERTRSQIVSEYFNIGDMVVYDSTLKILNQVDPRGVVIDRVVDTEIELYNSGAFDYFIVRASNFIHNEMDWQAALEVLARVPLPIYAVGVGAQSSGKGVYKLDGKNLAFWKTVSERSNVIGVRGTYSADVLAASGIHNVEIVGCPSLFRTRKRDLNIKPPENIRSVAFSIRREADHSYSNDVAEYRRKQRDLLLRTAHAYRTTVTIHGEPEEKAYYYQSEQYIAAARETLRKEQWFTPESEAAMEQIYRSQLFFFLDVSDYDRFIQTQEFAIGYRVHGILPALANGVPAVLVKYDSRSGELANTHAIPSIEANDVDRINMDELAASVDFSEFNRVHRLRYDKMKFVLDQNSLPHRL